jgi:two-component system, chemotaxis family, chemotaxis protein CheY
VKSSPELADNTVATMRSLIVEDNPVNQLFLKRVLAKHGVCDAFSNALDGIKAFVRALDQNQPYQLVCLDVSMQGLDGLDALKRIRAIETERGIVRHDCVRIFMVTAVGDPHIVKSAVSLSDAYLLKPVDYTTLIGCMRKLHLIDQKSEILEEFGKLLDSDEMSTADLSRIAERINASIARQSSTPEPSCEEMAGVGPK